MNNKIYYLLSFGLGAMSGALLTNYLLKIKYESILSEKVDSIKELYAKKVQKYEEIREETNEESDDSSDTLIEKSTIVKPTDEDLATYVDYAKKYTNEISPKEPILSESGEDTIDENKHDPSKPYIISPDEFGNVNGYSTISLSYYADGVLADENDEIIENIAETVGSDFAEHFGEYEDDSVFVRNDAKWCDYEILTDYRTYKSIINDDSSFVSEET